MDEASPITERVADVTEGIAYETIEAWTGVEQLDQYDDGHAVVLVRDGDALTLKVVALP
jgi:hypothetical protein